MSLLHVVHRTNTVYFVQRADTGQLYKAPGPADTRTNFKPPPATEWTDFPCQATQYQSSAGAAGCSPQAVFTHAGEAIPFQIITGRIVIDPPLELIEGGKK